MKRAFSLLIATSFLFVLSAATLAQTIDGPTRTPRINQRQRNQQQRIRQGVRSGELTRNEARRLERQEREIRQDERAVKADGVVTPAERREINRSLNRTNRRIYRNKHDRQDRD